MKSVKVMALTALPALCMAVLILDTKTALLGASAGLELCIRVVIPSLFPFLFVSVLVTGNLAGRNIPMMEPLGHLCGIPRGAEGLLAIGLIGGYPVGAQCVAQSYRNGILSERESKRMLGFCSNAGPSFLFGMLSGAFSNAQILWVLWAIHILSAILTGALLPGRSNRRVSSVTETSPSASEALVQSLKTMSAICGWVILFKVLLAYFQRWFLWAIPDETDILLSGILELTNGCCRLRLADAEGVRFLLASGLLAFGGICVGFQTISVTKDLGTGMYFPGKILQTAISLLLAYPAQRFLFGTGEQAQLHPTVLITCMIIVITAAKLLKKPVAF